MNNDFDIQDSEATFNFKEFLYRLLNYWPLFILSLAVSFGIAYYVNIRKLPVYQIENLISIKDDQNPFFTSNTSLTFNWGGTTDKVNTAVITLKSRTHNEKVVERLQYYLTYLKEGKYQMLDAYRQTPFTIQADENQPQLLNKDINLIFKDSVNFTLSIDFDEPAEVSQQIYHSKQKINQFVEAGNFSGDFHIGQPIQTPFFNGKIMPVAHNRAGSFIPGPAPGPGSRYAFRFQDFDSAVRQFLGIQVEPESRGSSTIRMRLTGNNKARMVDYLNQSVAILSEDMLKRKNLFATKTIQFIDSSLTQKSAELQQVEAELNQFRNRNLLLGSGQEGSEISSRLTALDLQQETVSRELSYYNSLQDYLITRSEYSDAPAPSVAGISEQSIVAGVGRIITLSEERNKLQYSFKEGAPVFSDIDRQIDAVKRVLLENIRSSKGHKEDELRRLKADIAGYESQIRKLPREQQDLLRIERKYNLSQGSYDLFMEKRSEAGLVKAANVSDVLIIDPAKDTGGGKIGPNTRLNYVMAALFGGMIPFFLVFVIVFFDTKIRNVKDLERLSTIPFLGAIGRNRTKNIKAVIDNPASPIAEAFRNLRASLMFLYKKNEVEGSRIVLLTSTVSGEGKTFCAVNLASIFALSEKKTVLIDFDMRKPKIHIHFQTGNNKGVVNFLVADGSVDQIIQKTELPYLDIIPSGPIPPNPSELLLKDRLNRLVEELKEKYDYIVFDSPPVGVVADSLRLSQLADATIYIVRCNYTRKNMLNFINEKYQKGEVNHVSIVLNEYVEKSGNYYGYGYGYGKYGYGYHPVQKRSVLQRVRSGFKK